MKDGFQTVSQIKELNLFAETPTVVDCMMNPTTMLRYSSARFPHLQALNSGL
jgi:hypothetical protein